MLHYKFHIKTIDKVNNISAIWTETANAVSVQAVTNYYAFVGLYNLSEVNIITKL